MRRDVRGGRLLHLFPPLCHRQSGAAERPAAEMAGCGGCSGPGLRRPHGSVLHGLSAGSTSLLFLQLRL